MISAACVVHHIRMKYSHKMRPNTTLVAKEGEEDDTELTNVNKNNKNETTAETDENKVPNLNDKSSEVDEVPFIQKDEIGV